ncbi:MAG: glycosyltransferase family 4 protein [Desulfatirhabdiaceae bacterium]
MRHLRLLYPVYFTGQGVTYTALSLAEAMQRPDWRVSLHCTSADKMPGADRLVPAIPIRFKSLVYRLMTDAVIQRFAEWRFLQSIQTTDVAYIWPRTTLATIQRIHQRGIPIVMERINCHRQTARTILTDAYARLGLGPPSHLSIRAAEIETQKLALASWIFSPSPMVKKSLLAEGIYEACILDTSYGWSPQRIIHTPADLPFWGTEPGLKVLFVGRLCVRKGVHLLLQAWAKSGIPGRLILAGRLDPDIADRFADLLKRPDVIQAGFVQDIAGLYHASDVFAFPSLEEGGPQVTYEAMACGLPVLVSPMGAGAIARDGMDGLVLNPDDPDAWVTALRQMASDADYRHRLGGQARERAQAFTWNLVGQRRAEMLFQRLKG